MAVFDLLPFGVVVPSLYGAVRVRGLGFFSALVVAVARDETQRAGFFGQVACGVVAAGAGVPKDVGAPVAFRGHEACRRVANRGKRASCQEKGTPRGHCQTKGNTVSIYLWLPLTCAGDRGIPNQIRWYGMDTLSPYASLLAMVAGDECIPNTQEEQ